MEIFTYSKGSVYNSVTDLYIVEFIINFRPRIATKLDRNGNVKRDTV